MPRSVDTFALLDPETLAEPYEFWSTLRRDAPVHFVSEGIGYWLVSRHADVVDALRRPELFLNQLSRRFKGGMSAYEDSAEVKAILAEGCPWTDVLSVSDGEVHTRHRRMVRRGFTVARVRELDEFVRLTVRELLDGLPTDSPVNLWTEFCFRLPIRVIGHILGVDPSHEDDVKRWADAQVARFGEPRESVEENVTIARDLVDFHQHIYHELAARRSAPQDDFLTDLLHASEDVSETELVLVCAQLLVAGAESTASLIGSMMSCLLDSPATLAALRQDPGRIKAVVEEALRNESPIKLVYRITADEVSIEGVTIPANSVVILMLGSANRDDAAFPDAAEFDAERENAGVRHVAFGLGTHLCSGAELARAEARIAFEELLARTTRIDRVGTGSPEHVPNLTVRALHDLPVILH